MQTRRHRLPSSAAIVAVLGWGIWHLSSSAIAWSWAGRRSSGSSSSTTSSSNAFSGSLDPSVLDNVTYQDGFGAAHVTAWRSGRFDVKLHGWGTGPTTEGCLEHVAGILAEIPSKDVFVYLDMRSGIGSSPRAVRAAFRFLGRHGHQLKRVVVIGPRPIIAFMRMVATVAHQDGVEFFNDPHKAEVWLSQEIARHSRAV
mmetsp:Transcript_72561/g.140253  ORF Transcript_72561/g.140253 Transcript_72561/m.140253 type:complete len:199 (+) Transcript_72561:39-635(+)